MLHLANSFGHHRIDRFASSAAPSNRLGKSMVNGNECAAKSSGLLKKDSCQPRALVVCSPTFVHM